MKRSEKDRERAKVLAMDLIDHVDLQVNSVHVDRVVALMNEVRAEAYESEAAAMRKRANAGDVPWSIVARLEEKARKARGGR
jgi:hypothetical protein